MAARSSPRFPSRADAIALAIIVVVLVLVFVPVWGGGRWFVSDGQFAHFFAPVSAWSDAWVGGWPAAADPATFAFYPLRLLLQPWGAFNAFVIAGYVIAGTGLYWYLRLVDVTPAGAALGALGFASSGFMVGHLWNAYMVHAAAWIPWALAGIEAALQSGRRRWPFLVAIAVALGLLSGHVQIALYGLLLTGLYLALRLPFAWRTQRMRAWVRAAAAPVAGVILAAPQLFATWSYLPETPRAQLTFALFAAPALSWLQVPLLFFPFAFGGGIAPYTPDYFGPNLFPASCFHMPLLLLVLAIGGACERERRRDALFWSAVVAVGFALALGNALPRLAHLAYQVPVLNAFRGPGRHVMEACFATSILAAFGFDALTKVAPPRKGRWLVAATVAILMLLGALATVVRNYAALEHWGTTHRLPVPAWPRNVGLWIPLGLALPALGACAIAVGRRTPTTKSVALLAVAALQAWAFVWFAQWNLTSPSVASYAPLPVEQRVMDGLHTAGGRVLNVAGMRGGVLSPERSRLFGLSSANWYGPLIPARAALALRMASPSGASPVLSMAPADVALDVYGVRYLVVGLDDGAHFPGDRFRLVGTAGDEAVWENSRALPLAWPVGKWTEMDDEPAVEALHGQGLAGGRIFDPAREAIVADVASAEVEGFDTTGRVQARWVGDGAIAAATDVATGSLVVFSVNDVAGWRASVDGAPVPIQRANVALMAVAVPAGKHRVELEFDPPAMPRALQAGLGGGLLGFVLLCLVGDRRATAAQPD